MIITNDNCTVRYRLTRVLAALAGGQSRRRVLLEQERGRGVVVILDGRQPLVRFVVHGRVVAVLGLVTHVADQAAAADRHAAAAAAADAPAVQRRRPDRGLGAVQVFHVDGLLLGRAQRGLLELEQRDLLPAALQRQGDRHADDQQHGHGQRPGHQAHVRLGAVARTRSWKTEIAVSPDRVKKSLTATPVRLGYRVVLRD